jgi:hypothetical protein
MLKLLDQLTATSAPQGEPLMDLSKINPRADFMCPTCGQEVTSNEAHEHVTKTVVERYARYDQTYTCLVSGNAVGTDTHPLGAGCDCQVCRLVEEIIQLRVELDVSDPSPIRAELDNLKAEMDELRRELAVNTPRCDHDWQPPPGGRGASICTKCKQHAVETFRTSSTLTFEFPDVEAANDFKTWLCNSGEQQYWNDAERFVDFDYFQGSVVPCEWRKSDA